MLPSIRYVEHFAAGHDGDLHDSIGQMAPIRSSEQFTTKGFPRMLNGHHGVQSPEQPLAVVGRMKLSINSLLLAPPAAPLVETTNNKRSPSSPASTLQHSLKKQLARKHAFRTTVKVGAGYQTIFPLPKLLARPPSTEMLAPGTHLYADSKRWPNRNCLDRSFIKRLAVNDIDSFRPAAVIHVPSLLVLL
ncbi:hypothetical protein LTR17_023811 [Elasticomyces elasticus]|nr:hypothetical protein LTR17_023811 [Elasticomyces elasticus]